MDSKYNNKSTLINKSPHVNISINITSLGDSTVGIS